MDLISELEEKGYKRYFPKTYSDKRLDYQDKSVLALLRGEKILEIVLYFLDHEGKAKHNEINNDLGLARSTLSYHLKELEKKNILKKDGRTYKIINKN
ncbi:MAG: ArsR family transcriptional regulator [Thermoplasmatota archaeon]